MRTIFFLVFALGIFACGGDDAASVPPGTCLVPALCDITQSSCQAAVLNLTACVRGNSAPSSPDVRVIKPDAFRKELEAENADQDFDPAEDKALAALHLVPQDGSVKDALVDAQADSVAAYYDDDMKRVTIIDAPSLSASDALSNMYTLSHELTHYLQDDSLGIANVMERFGESLDGVQAGRSLIEGEAVVTSTRALAALAGRSTNELDWPNFIQGITDSTLEDMRDSAAPLAVGAVELPYVFGTPYIQKVWDAGGRKRVDELFDDAPLSAVDWLAGYGDDGPRDSLTEPLDCGPPLAPDGFKLVELDSFGITGAVALLTAAGTRSELKLVSTLASDALAIYSSGEGDDLKALVAWRLRFTTSSAARAFASALDGFGLEPRTFDNEVLIVASSDKDAPSFDNAALEACPALDDAKAQLKSASSMSSALRLRRPH